jgi:hypothetical protein
MLKRWNGKIVKAFEKFISEKKGGSEKVEESKSKRASKHISTSTAVKSVNFLFVLLIFFTSPPPHINQKQTFSASEHL